LVPLKDGKALAQAILRLLDNPKESQRIAEKGRAFVERQFSVDRMVESTFAVYDELMTSSC